jgi:hypothetical protein
MVELLGVYYLDLKVRNDEVSIFGEDLLCW